MLVKLRRKMNSLLLRILPHYIYESIRWLYFTIFYIGLKKNENMVQKYIKGNNKKKGKPCIIYQISSSGIGILVLYRNCLSEIAKYKKKGYTVAIDYEKPINICDEKIGCENIWDRVFEQPCGMAVEEVLAKDKVIVKRTVTYFVNAPVILKEYKPEYYKKVNRKFSNVFTIKKELQTAWDIRFGEMFDGNRVLGISLRELFRIMRSNHTGWSERHPDEPDIEEIIEVVISKMQEYNCEYIFLATEFMESINSFKDTFGDKLLYTNRSRQCMDQEYINDVKRSQRADISMEEMNEVIERDDARTGGNKRCVEYVEEMYGLSKCTSLIGTPSGGLRIALFWNAGKYENVSFWGEKSRASDIYF